MEQTATEPVSATYHVFINHRGSDVKKTLASFIYHRLTNCHGLRVFLDNKELRTGDTLSPAILGAIQSASVHIALFTEHYAESPWCLEELRWILRSYHKRNIKIIPAFCDVEPKDLRYVESGRYAKAFEEHQRKGRVAMESIQRWKAALNQASHISGLLFKSNESDHGEFLERIVIAVLKEVKLEPLEVATYPVGLEQAMEDLQSKILKESELNGTIIVGIAGVGGVGKSALAKFVYNLKRSDFTRSCYLSEISNDQEVRYIMGKFKVKMVDIIFDTPTSEWHMKIENFHSHSAILLCFISPHLPLARVALLRVRFGASSYDATFQEYTTLRYRGERTLHVFIWTDESSLFKDYKGYRDIDVYCSDDSGTHSTVRLGKNASEFDAGSVKMGWLLMVDKNIDVSKVGKEFIIAFA